MRFTVGGSATRAGIAAVETKLRTLAAEIGTRYDVRLALPDEDADHLRWFDGGTSKGQPPRPVFLRTPDVEREVRDAMRPHLTGERFNKLVALTAGAQALRAAWVRRLSTNGGGLSWSPLSPAYAAWKHRRGLDPRMGVARGQMLAAVRSGLVVVRRIG